MLVYLLLPSYVCLARELWHASGCFSSLSSSECVCVCLCVELSALISTDVILLQSLFSSDSDLRLH